MTPSSEIYIDATETDPAVRAQAALRSTHQRLHGRLVTLVEVEPVAAAGESARAALVGFCGGELRRYLDACDQTLYAAAAGAAETRLLVRALRTTSGLLGRNIEALSSAADAAAAVSVARAIEAMLLAQLTVERAVLLPAVAGLPGADLPTLVADLHTLLDGGRLDSPAVVDVRLIPHGQRHPRIFARFARLAPGESFTLVNNHDPKPLRREFQAAYPGAFSWEYVEQGPEQWQIRIGRPAGTGD